MFVLPEVFDNGENTFADIMKSKKRHHLLPRFSIYSLLYYYAPTLLSVPREKRKDFYLRIIVNTNNSRR